MRLRPFVLLSALSLALLLSIVAGYFLLSRVDAYDQVAVMGTMFIPRGSAVEIAAATRKTTLFAIAAWVDGAIGLALAFFIGMLLVSRMRKTTQHGFPVLATSKLLAGHEGEKRIAFRPLSRSDFPLLQRWLSEPYVNAWWRQPLDLAGVQSKYGPRVDGIEPTHVFVITYGRRPIGWIQWYRWSDYPEHAAQLGTESVSAGIDLALGEQDMLGLGLGPIVIREFINQFVFADPNISAVMTDVEEANLRSLRAFAKAGFQNTKTVQLRDENFNRCVLRLDRLL